MNKNYIFSFSYFKGLFDNTFSSLFTRFSISLLIILIGFIIGKLTGKILEKILSELELNKILKNISGLKLNLEKIIGSFVSYFIFFMSFIMALNQLGITTDVLNILSAAIMILIVLSIFLGIKDFIPNFIAGLYLSRKELFCVGDVIIFKEMEGKILEINLLEVIIETKSKDKIYIPNVNFTKNEVVKVKTTKSKIKEKVKGIKKIFKKFN